MRLTLASLLVILLLAAPLGGCSREDSTPQGAVKAFMTAVASIESAKAYALLAPSTRKALKVRAAEASRHTGGRKQLKPEDMILLGLVQSLHEVSSVEVISEAETEAKVRLTSGGKKPVVEELTLEKEDGGWRILLKIPEPTL